MSYFPAVKIKDKDGNIDNPATQEGLDGLQMLANMIAALSRACGIAADIRVTPIGGTVSTVTTVTTVTTVGNQTSIGGFAANQQVFALQNQLAIDANIRNITLP